MAEKQEALMSALSELDYFWSDALPFRNKRPAAHCNRHGAYAGGPTGNSSYSPARLGAVSGLKSIAS